MDLEKKKKKELNLNLQFPWLEWKVFVKRNNMIDVIEKNLYISIPSRKNGISQITFIKTEDVSQLTFFQHYSYNSNSNLLQLDMFFLILLLLLSFCPSSSSFYLTFFYLETNTFIDMNLKIKMTCEESFQDLQNLIERRDGANFYERLRRSIHRYSTTCNYTR